MSFKPKRDMDEDDEHDESAFRFPLSKNPLTETEGGPAREEDGHAGDASAMLANRSRPAP
jgi:hypothetical protein